MIYFKLFYVQLCQSLIVNNVNKVCIKVILALMIKCPNKFIFICELIKYCEPQVLFMRFVKYNDLFFKLPNLNFGFC